MSVYIFGSGASIYNDKITAHKEYNTPTSDTIVQKLSTMDLNENTTPKDVIIYGDKLRSELENIRQIFLDDPQTKDSKDYENFLKIKMEIFEYIDDLIRTYRLYVDASKLTANRKAALKNKILTIGLKLRSLISSYNTSGIFMSKNLTATIPTKNSREEIIRSRLLQSIGEF